MKITKIISICSVMGATLFAGLNVMAKSGATDPVIAVNPMNINYRFQPGDEVRREAADPVIEWFKDAYYLFASKSGGYWRSEDLCNWDYIRTNTIATIEDYAPTVFAIGDTLYFKSSDSPRIFKNPTPEVDTWVEVKDSKTPGEHDPCFYQDEDGRAYIYWGCHDKDPIMGVEIDPKNNFAPIGEPVKLILHNHNRYGWEVPGVANEEPRPGWNEGPCMLKLNGKYYLHYAAPGTQYRIYGDGIYVGDSPLGPFEYVEDNPFSFKPGGFIAGAGHGHTFFDKHGNLWHVATMAISVRHWFERRLGLFPIAINKNGNLEAITTWSDYPYYIPQEKVDFNKFKLSPEWNLLSLARPVKASSELKNYEAAKAVDETVETWWAASSGKVGEWYQVDLGKVKDICAVQVNFADHNFKVRPPHGAIAYQYVVEASDNGSDWATLFDMSKNKLDEPHKLLLLDKPVKYRYIRIKNLGALDGNFSLYDLRVFGHGVGSRPAKVKDFKAVRNDNDGRRFSFTWSPVKNADGYVIRWGVHPEHLSHSVTLPSQATSYEAGYFNRDSKYYFSISAYNACGEGKVQKIK